MQKRVLLRICFNGGETEAQQWRSSRPGIHYIASVGSERMIALPQSPSVGIRASMPGIFEISCFVFS